MMSIRAVIVAGSFVLCSACSETAGWSATGDGLGPIEWRVASDCNDYQEPGQTHPSRRCHVTGGFGSTNPDDSKEWIYISDDLATDLGLSPDQQVRVWMDGDGDINNDCTDSDLANPTLDCETSFLFTVKLISPAGSQAPQLTIDGKARVENSITTMGGTFIENRDLIFDTAVVHPEGHGAFTYDLKEQVVDDVTQQELLVMAPHGTEEYTRAQAKKVCDTLPSEPCGAWRTFYDWENATGGWASEEGHARLHITSTEIATASFPMLADIQPDFEDAYAFHGFREHCECCADAPISCTTNGDDDDDVCETESWCADGNYCHEDDYCVYVGGGTSSQAAQAVLATLLEAELESVVAPSSRLVVRSGDDVPGYLRGKSSANIVNWMTAGEAHGIQIEQSRPIRIEVAKRDEVATTVADFHAAWRSGTGSELLDQFDRLNGNDLGATMPTGGFTWYEVGDPLGEDGYLSIDGGRLLIHHSGGGAAQPRQSAAIMGLQLSDVDVSMSAQGYDVNSMTDRPFGLSYRMENIVDGGYDTPGYHLRVELDSVSLWAGDVELASTTTAGPSDSSPYTYRVVALGPYHRVYKDEEVILAVFDDTYMDPGFLGVFGYDSISYIDDFQAKEPTSAYAFDDFERGATELELGMVPFGSGGPHTWQESAVGTAAYLHVDTERVSSHYFCDEVPCNFAEPAPLPHQYAYVVGIDLADVDVAMRARGYVNPAPGGMNYMESPRVFGLSYRMPVGGNYLSDGYHLRISWGELALYRGSTELGTAAGPTDAGWHDYRVVANGDEHGVYMDGIEMMTITDDSPLKITDPGKAGFFGYYSVGWLDDFLAADATPPAP